VATLFVMERIPKPEVGCCTTDQYSDQFEAFVFGRTKAASLASPGSADSDPVVSLIDVL
jgi:hypothetical protein